MGQQAATQRYRVETDQGSFIVEVEAPPAAEVPRPNTIDFVKNVASSGMNLARGVASLATGVSGDQMIDGVIHRLKEYAGDIHPIEAGRQLLGGNPLTALSNLLPVETMYRDPVGVAADVAGVATGVRGGRAAVAAPDNFRTWQTQRFNRKPLMEQMDRLPIDRPAPEVTRGGGNPPPVQGGVNDLPLSTQQTILERTVPSRPAPERSGGATPPATGGQNINDLPLWKQQEILEQTVPSRPSVDTGRRGGDVPPDRSVAAASAPVPSRAPQVGSTFDPNRVYFTPETPPPNSVAAVEAPVDWSKVPAHAVGNKGGSLDLSQFSEAAREAILKQLRGEPATPPAAASAPAAVPDPNLPMWNRGGGSDAPLTLAEERRLGGARSVGGRPLEGEVRAAVDGPSQTPLRAENAWLDSEYARRIMDEGGFFRPDLPSLLAHMMMYKGLKGGLGAVSRFNANAGTPALHLGGVAGAARFNDPALTR